MGVREIIDIDLVVVVDTSKEVQIEKVDHEFHLLTFTFLSTLRMYSILVNCLQSDLVHNNDPHPGWCFLKCFSRNVFDKEFGQETNLCTFEILIIIPFLS